MSNQKQSITQISDKLLTAAELAVCQKIAALDTELAGRRAAILVAIDEGSTQAQASEQTGLTMGQIRYLLTTFRRKRLAIFPEDVLSQVQSAAEPREEAQAEVQPVVGSEEETKKFEEALKDEGASNEASPNEVAEIEKEVKQALAEVKEERKPKKSKKAKRDKTVKLEKAKIKAKEKEKGKKSKMTKKDKAKKAKKDKKSKKGKAKKADKKKSKK